MQKSPKIYARSASARGFTLVDLLVSMAVILVLIGILTPTVSMARNAAYRSACSSNVRQLGLASQMFAYDHQGKVPTSVFSAGDNTYQHAPGQTVLLRINASNALFAGTSTTMAKDKWDGLGLLHKLEYVDAPEVFYCPKQTSEHTIDRYRANFNGTPGEIAGNYQLRLPDPKKYLSDLNPAMAIIANSMRTTEEYSHKTGNNMLLADMSVQWFAEGARLMAFLHPTIPTDTRGDIEQFESAWKFLDLRHVPIDETGRDGHSTNLGGDPSANPVDKTKKAGSSE